MSARAWDRRRAAKRLDLLHRRIARGPLPATARIVSNGLPLTIVVSR